MFLTFAANHFPVVGYLFQRWSREIRDEQATIDEMVKTPRTCLGTPRDDHTELRLVPGQVNTQHHQVLPMIKRVMSRMLKSNFAVLFISYD
jgi:hypothetical protein